MLELPQADRFGSAQLRVRTPAVPPRRDRLRLVRPDPRRIRRRLSRRECSTKADSSRCCRFSNKTVSLTLSISTRPSRTAPYSYSYNNNSAPLVGNPAANGNAQAVAVAAERLLVSFRQQPVASAGQRKLLLPPLSVDRPGRADELRLHRQLLRLLLLQLAAHRVQRTQVHVRTPRRVAGRGRDRRAQPHLHARRDDPQRSTTAVHLLGVIAALP